MENIFFPIKKIGDGKIIAFTIIGMIFVLVISLTLIGNGAVRHVPITYTEIIQTTVAFKEVKGEVKIVGITGNTGINPTLISRTGDNQYQYALMVVNQDRESHMFYIDGINAYTKLLRHGENDTIIITSNKEGTYNYYDRSSVIEKDNKLIPLGQFKFVKVAGD
ncbi:MAG: hypothetical protein ACPKQO_10475 [Nitrososphaeraceae archaeon]